MSIDALSPLGTWGLPAVQFRSASSAAPPILDIWAQSTYATLRVGSRFVSIIISRVPPSETRMLNEGLLPFYQVMRKVSDCLEEIAQQHNITLPKCPPIDLDYHVECQTDIGTLKSARAVPPANALADIMERAENGDSKYHWSSLVACTVVPTESVVAQTVTAISNGTATTHSLFTQAITSPEFVSACRVILGELARMRHAPTETGWREDEARSLVEEHFKSVEYLASTGKLCEE